MAGLQSFRVYHLYKLYILIFATLHLVSCKEETKVSEPCSLKNSTTGALLCCSGTIALVSQPFDEECVEVLPLKSAPLLPEFWSTNAFKLARQRKKNIRPTVATDNRIDTHCCCKQKIDFILPDMATTTSGRVTQVFQSYMGYVQPITARMCQSMSCSWENKGQREITSCIQDWGATDLYIEDHIHRGFLRKENIRVPTGCKCGKQVQEWMPTENVTRTSLQHNRQIKNVTVTTLRAINGDTDISDTPNNWGESAAKNVNATEKEIKYDLGNIFIQNASSDDRRRPQINTNATNDQLLKSQKTAFNEQQSQFNSNSQTINTSSYKNPMVDESQLPIPNNFPSIFKPPYYNQGETYIQGNSLNVNSLPLGFGKLVPQEQLKELGSLAFSPLLPEVNSQVINEINNLNSAMASYIQMGLLSGMAHPITTAQIVENALTKVHSSQQMQALAMAERLMLLELEYLRLSMNMLDMTYRNLNTSALQGAQMNNPDRNSIPVSFKPEVPQDLLQFQNAQENIVTLSSANALAISQTYKDTKPFVLGIKPEKEYYHKPQMSASEKENSLTAQGVSSSLKIVSPPPRTETTSSKPATKPNTDITPSSDSNVTLRADPLPINASRVSVLDEMIEEKLHSAFADFIFIQAFMNDSCTVPQTIKQSHSELYFLPSLLKESFNVEAKGMLNIHKFASRIIEGIIMCQFQDMEAALLDGRLASAISGGIKVAQLLNTHIRIMKEMMRGILDADEATGLVNLLRWASRGTGSPSRLDFVSATDATDVESLMLVVKASLREYVDYLKSKTSKYPANPNSQSHTNLLPTRPLVHESNVSPSNSTAAQTSTHNHMSQLSGSASSSSNKLSSMSTNMGNGNRYDYPEENLSTNKSQGAPLRFHETKPEDFAINETIVTAIIKQSTSIIPLTFETKNPILMDNKAEASFSTSQTSAIITPEFDSTIIFIGFGTNTGNSELSTTSSATSRPSTTIAMMGTDFTVMSKYGTTLADTVANMTESISRTETLYSSTANVPLVVITTVQVSNSTNINMYETITGGSGSGLKSSLSPGISSIPIDIPYTHTEVSSYKTTSIIDKTKYTEKPVVFTFLSDPNKSDATPLSETDENSYKDNLGYAGNNVYGYYDYYEKDKEPYDNGYESYTYNYKEGPGPEDYEGSGAYAQVSPVLSRDQKNDPYDLSDLPREYDPLDIAPGSLMNLLFPNLR